MRYSFFQDNIFGKILVAFLTVGLLFPSFIPITSYAQVDDSTATQQVIIRPQPVALTIPKIIIGTSTILDLSRVDWDQTIDIGGQQIPLSSSTALQSLSNVPDDIKHLVLGYATDMAAINTEISASSTNVAKQKAQEKLVLQKLIAETLIANGQLPADYFTLEQQNQIISADNIIDLNKTQATQLAPSAGKGAENSIGARVVGVQTNLGNTNINIAQPGDVSAPTISLSSPGTIIKSAEDAQAWRTFLAERLTYAQSQVSAPPYVLQEAEYAQGNFEKYLLKQGFTQTLDGAISSPTSNPGVSLSGAMKWLFGWIMPQTANAASYLFGPEDFESCSTLATCSFLGQSGWGSVTSTLDTGGKVDGSNSLRDIVSGEGAAVLEKNVSSTSEMWVQFKVWVPNPLTFGPSGYFSILMFEDSGDSDRVWLDVEHDASATLTLGGQILPYINTGVHLTPGVVNTIEMHLKNGTSTGAIDIWLNNTNQASPNYHGTNLDVGTSTINFFHGGLNYAPESGVSDSYYDDFIFNNSFIGAWSNSAPASSTNMLVEGQTNPTAVQVSSPYFSATYNDSNATDTANKYRIEVSTSSAFSSLDWDSGTVSMASTTVGSQSPNIAYTGPTLATNVNYYWRIRFVDAGKLSGAWNTTTSTFTLAPNSGLSSSTTAGLTYLINDQNTDGSWGSTTTSFLATAAVLDVFNEFNATGTSYENGIDWLDSYITENNYDLAQQIKISAAAGEATTSVEDLVAALDQDMGGFSFNPGYSADPGTTAEALQALTTSGYVDSGANPSLTTSLALYYLTQTQNSDGGWGAFDGGASSIPTTGEVIDALLPYKNQALSGFIASGTIPIATYLNNAISELQATQNSSGTWKNNLLDTAIAFYAMESAGVTPTYQNAAIAYLQAAQAGNGSFASGDPYITAKVVKALGIAPLAGAIGNPFVSNISTTTALQTGASTSLQIAVTNVGTAAVSTGVLQLMMDNFNIASIDLAANGIVINPSSTQNITIQIPNTVGLVGSVTTTAYLEGANGAAYPNSRYDKTLIFAADPSGLPGLPIYFTAQKVTASGAPSFLETWNEKADPNRSSYAVMWRNVGSSTWNVYLTTSSAVFASGIFTEDQALEVTLGVTSPSTSTIVYYTNPVTVLLSASSTKYATGTISGLVSSAGQPLPNITIGGNVLGTSDSNGNYTIGNVPYGAGTISVDDFRYEPFLSRFVDTGSNLSNVKVPTIPVIDTQNPTVTGLTPFSYPSFQVPNQQPVIFDYSIADDVGYASTTGCIQSANFEYYDPNDTQWHPIGTQEGTLCSLGTYQWIIPSNLLGSGYEVRVTGQDFSGKYSTPDVYGPFQITTGNAQPTFSFTAPGAGSGTQGDLDYLVKWSAWDDSTSTSINLYADTDQDPNNGNGTLIDTAHTGDLISQYDWNTSGVATGTYYLRAIVNDGFNGSTVVTSPGITIVHNAPTAPTGLLTNGQSNPTNTTSSPVVFSAVYNDPNSTGTATSYQVQVATSTSGFASSNIWDSGEAALSTSTSKGSSTPNITYGGAILAASTTYYWRIRLWDSDGNQGAWSSATSSFIIANLPPTNLHVNGQTNPTGVTSTPQFSATYNNSNASDSANEYRIQVSTSSSFASIFWDSGTSVMATTTVGSSSPSISYGGSTLAASTTYYWRILFIDIGGSIGAWSVTTSTFSLLSTSTISFVQAVNNNATTTAATTTVSGVTAGDLLMIEQTYTGTVTTTPPIDDAGTLIFITSSTWHSTAHSYLFYEKNAATGTHHIHTVYSGTPSFPAVFATEYSGVSTSTPLDTFSVATGTGGTMTSAVMTSTIANEMAFGFGNAAGQTLTAGTGFALRGTQHEIEDNAPSTMSAGGAVSTTFSGAATADWVVQGVLINPSTWTNLAPTAPTSLLAQGQTNPTGVTSTAPSFSAIYNDPNRGDSANKYHLQVSTSSAFSSIFWDSATSTMATTTAGSRIPNITYGGSTLTASTTYYWRILFVDTSGASGAWSTATSTFSRAYLFGPETFESCSALPCGFSWWDSWGGVTSTLDTTGKVDGTKSFRDIVSGEGAAILEENVSSTSEIWAQFKIWVPNPLVFSTSGFFSILMFEDSGDSDQVWLDLEHDASATLTLGGVNLPYINTGIHFTPGVVNTVQMHLKTGTSTGAIDIWLNNNNQSSPNYHGTGLDVGTSTINFVHGGLNYVPETGLSDTYYDDFTINNGFIL